MLEVRVFLSFMPLTPSQQGYHKLCPSPKLSVPLKIADSLWVQAIDPLFLWPRQGNNLDAIKSPYQPLSLELFCGFPECSTLKTSFCKNKTKHKPTQTFFEYAICFLLRLNHYTYFYSCSTLRLKQFLSSIFSGQLLNMLPSTLKYSQLPLCYFPCCHHRMDKLIFFFFFAPIALYF